MVVPLATKAEGSVVSAASFAGEAARVHPHDVWAEEAQSSHQRPPCDTVEASAVHWVPSPALSWHVYARPFEKELLTVAHQLLHAFATFEFVPGGAVQAPASVGVVPVTFMTDCLAAVLDPVEPEPRLTAEEAAARSA